MVRDFGAGLTADELIGMPAWHIANMDLPRGDAFDSAYRAAELLVNNEAENFVLEELWADGHSVWQNPETRAPAVVTPNGQIIRERP